MAKCDKCGGEIVFRNIDDRIVPIHITGNCANHIDFVTERARTEYKSLQKLIKSSTTPNVACPVCGKPVFYYQNEHNSRVFFDQLGPPWPKHACTDRSANHPHISRESRKRPVQDELLFYKAYVKSRKTRRDEYGAKYFVWNIVLQETEDFTGPMLTMRSKYSNLALSDLIIASFFARKVSKGHLELHCLRSDTLEGVGPIQLYGFGHVDADRKKRNHLRDLFQSVPRDLNINHTPAGRVRKYKYSCKLCARKFQLKASRNEHQANCVKLANAIKEKSKKLKCETASKCKPKRNKKTSR